MPGVEPTQEQVEEHDVQAEDHDVPEPSEGIWVLAVLVGAVVLLYARAPFAASKFWAEDGTVFYQQAVEKGVIPAFGEPWAGYFHLVPRVSGAISSSVPIADAPLANWIVLAASIAWCAVTVFIASRTWVTSLPARLLLASGVVLLPAIGLESIGNIANLHFIMLFPAAVVLISKPKSRAEGVNSAAFTIISTLSTLQTLVLFPLVAYRVVRKPRRLDAISILWCIGSAVHLLAVFIVGPEREAAGTASIVTIVGNYGRGVIVDAFSPVRSLTVLVGFVLAGVIAFVVGRALMLCWKDRDWERVFLMLAMPGAGALLWTFLGLRLGFTTARYSVFASMGWIWTVIVAAQIDLDRLDERHWLRRMGGMRLVAALIFLAWLPNLGVSDYRRSGPSWSDARSMAEDQCRATNEDSVTVQIAPTNDQDLWPVHFRCDDVP